MTDMFSLNGAVAPEGMHYEWKTFSIHDIEQPEYQKKLQAEGWQPVPANRHPEISSEDPANRVIRWGMLLMERPVELSIESRKADFRANQKKLDSVADLMTETVKKATENYRSAIEIEASVVHHVAGFKLPAEKDLIFDEKGAATSPAYVERMNIILALENGEER